MTDLGERLPSVDVTPPGPASRDLARRLRAAESRNVTYLSDGFPTFWTEARGANVRDADGNVYVDLTSAFGVSLAGHAHPRIVAAVEAQASRLLHGMGDVHPPAVKVELLERLQALAPWPGARTVLASTGSEAVEIALKTAALATERPGVLAFEGAYHGLTLGALATTARAHFRDPFKARLYEGVAWVPFPETAEAGAEVLALVEGLLDRGVPSGDAIGTVLLEPVQGRAGVRLFPAGFLAALADAARRRRALVVADEVFTGVGRCGAPLASTRLGLVPDLLCLGKALGGGLPVSACMGAPGIMEAWPESSGEAVHTSTFLGHPLGCAAALATLDLVAEGMPAEAERVGTELTALLRHELEAVPSVADIRGLGALVGVELSGPGGDDPPVGAAAKVAEAALRRGVLVLPAGEHGHVVELTPPVTLTRDQARAASSALGASIREVMG